MIKKYEDYKPVPTSLLAPDVEFVVSPEQERSDREKANTLEETFKSFGINAEVINIVHGHTVTRFELTAENGTKVSKIKGLHNELMMALAAHSLRIVAPVPGKAQIHIEIPNEHRVPVTLRGLAETDQFMGSSPLTVAMGRYLSGEPVYCDIAKNDHLLIAGSMGSGTAVCINLILTSILMHSSPDDVRMILADPKYYEFILYRNIPHLLVPLINDFFETVAALKWATAEKKRRYDLFAEGQVKNIKEFNEKYKDNPNVEHLPDIIIVINELADFMYPSSWARGFEEIITRLAINSKSAGIHLIITTQHPSVSVLAGVRKVIGSRIAFAVISGVDSRTIIESTGAEQLIGKSDMLNFPSTSPSPLRSQGATVSDAEVESVVGYIKNKYSADYDESVMNEIKNYYESIDRNNFVDEQAAEEEQKNVDLFNRAVDLVILTGSASVSVIQKELGIGYPRAARLIDELEKEQIIGPFEGAMPRKVLITEKEWQERKDK